MNVLAIVLDGFYVAVVSQGGEGPLVVHRDRRILDANAEAKARGVVVGMPLAEARSVLAVEGRLVLWEHEAYREAERRWLEVVSEYSDVVEPLRQHEALADLSGHPRPRDAAARLEDSLRKAGFAPRAGTAACRWVARLAARRGDPLGLAYADPRNYVADVPVASLPVAPETAKRLELLGYRTAGDVTALRVDVLRAQFGDEAHGIARAAIGRGDVNVRALFPEHSVAARFVFDGEPQTRQELEAGLGRLAREIGSVLRDRDAAGRLVELFLERDDASVTRLARTFTSSLTCEREVLNALGLMLPHTPERGVESVRARLPELRATRRVQLDTGGGRSRSDQAESVRVALSHVRGTFGDGSIKLVSEIRESRRARVRRAYRELNGWAWR